MVTMSPNWAHLSDVRDLLGDLGAKKMSCLRFVPQTRGKKNKDFLAMDKQEFARMQFLFDQELARVHPVELRLGCPIDFRHGIGLQDEKSKPCHAGDDLILVRPNGNVHPCAAWKSLPVDTNVRNFTLREIWENSEVFNAIRLFKTGRALGDIELQEPGYTSVGGACARCDLLHSCITGCPAQRLHAYDGRGMEGLYVPFSDPLCPRGNGMEYDDEDIEI